VEQEFEIEFKNMLTEIEYKSILQKEFTDYPHSKHMTTQTNHYFDTMNKILKEHDSALRIRTTDAYNELTLKVPYQDFLMETNISLTTEQITDILNTKHIVLSSYLSKDDELSLPEGVTDNTIFDHFNSFQTKRLEKQMGEHLIVLDQTFFQNGTVDYELEVESTDAALGEDFFESFLSNHSIPRRQALPKIARAENN